MKKKVEDPEAFQYQNLNKKLKKAFIKYNGILTYELARSLNINENELLEACEKGQLIQEKKGIFLIDESCSDDMYVTQLIYQDGIFSHESACMLHGLTTFSPFRYLMSFSEEKPAEALKMDLVEPYYESVEYNRLGVVEVDSWFRNPLRVTDMERTVIDMLRSPHALSDVLEEVIDNYVAKERKDMGRLYEYAALFDLERLVQEKIEKKVLFYKKNGFLYSKFSELHTKINGKKTHE